MLFRWLFTDFEQVKKIDSHFVDSEQHKNIISYFGDFEQLKKSNTIQLVRPPLATYSSLCSTCVTYGMSCQVIGNQLLPTHPSTASAMDLKERFVLSDFFLPYTPSYWF